MRRLILAVASMSLMVAALVVLAAAAKPDAKRVRPYGLRGRVKCFTETRARVTFENGKYVESAAAPTMTVSFNEDGSVAATTIYGPDGAILRAYTLSHFLLGNQEFWVNHNLDGTISSHSVNVHNKKGNVVETLNYDSAGNLSGWGAMSYLEDGTVQSATYNAKGGVVNYWTVRHDEARHTTDEIRRNPDGTLASHVTMTYDPNGKMLLRVIDIYAQSPPTADGAPYMRMVDTFDADGNRLSETDYGPHGSVSRKLHMYEADANENWIKQTVSEWVERDGRWSYEPTEITYREITYYPEPAGKNRPAKMGGG